MRAATTRFLRRFSAVLVALAVLPASSAVADNAASARARSRDTFAAMPLRFEPNLGRVADGGDVDFVARGDGYAMRLSARGPMLFLRGASGNAALLDIRLASARQVVGVGLEPLPGWTNDITGHDSSRWRTGVRGYGAVEYRDVYPGVTAVYYGNHGRLEYDFVVAPGARADRIALSFDGANAMKVDERGDLIGSTAAGDLVQHAPVIYQTNDNGTRSPVEGRYALRGRTVAFHIGRYDRRRPLVIDPVLTYSTYLGGSNSEFANGLAIDAHDNVYIAGYTYSLDCPTVNGAPPTPGAAYFQAAFVARMTAAGDALVYATYIGGSGPDEAAAIKVDAAGNAYITGTTFSHDFPVMNAAQPQLHGLS